LRPLGKLDRASEILGFDATSYCSRDRNSGYSVIWSADAVNTVFGVVSRGKFQTANKNDECREENTPSKVQIVGGNDSRNEKCQDTDPGSETTGI